MWYWGCLFLPYLLWVCTVCPLGCVHALYKRPISMLSSRPALLSLNLHSLGNYKLHQTWSPRATESAIHSQTGLDGVPGNYEEFTRRLQLYFTTLYNVRTSSLLSSTSNNTSNILKTIFSVCDLVRFGNSSSMIVS